jgi:hypothetical protein
MEKPRAAFIAAVLAWLAERPSISWAGVPGAPPIRRRFRRESACAWN